MTAPFRDMRLATAYVVPLAAPDDFDGWRDHARRLLRAEVPPDRVAWSEPGGEGGDLFAGPGGGDKRLPTPHPDGPQPRSSRAFLELARKAILHRDPQRFALLYRLLWRLQAHPRLMEDAADPDVRRLEELARTVRRDIHKMRAFVRFRMVEEGGGEEHYVAWFEPEHHILRANARFFVDRFTTMRWSILTPQGALRWDGAALSEGPPAHRADAPAGDPAEALWKRYYASIFNPARLKTGAMLKEMPRKYWKNMPKAALIPDLVAGAQAREAAMIEAGGVEAGATMFEAERPKSLEAIGAAILECRRCPIGCNGTRAVMGEGPKSAAQGFNGLMIVGEQPGDVEEQGGRPFIGPAGKLLRAHLEDAGIDDQATYVTNAVKHFKFVPKVLRGGGKRRLHQSPTAKEIDICRWWVESERGIVQPQLVLALGASATRGMLGRTVSVQKERGRPHTLEDGAELWITTHPSYLLRLHDEGRATEEARFAAELRKVAARLAELVG